MRVEALYDSRTNTLTYLAWDADSLDAVVVDPVLDYDPASGRLWHESLERLQDLVDKLGVKVHAVLETHAHADHLSGAQVLRERWGVPVMIGQGITQVQSVFAPVFGMDVALDGSQFDRLLADGERVSFGSLELEVIGTPGHTPACSAYRIRDTVFTGDALFMPDSGVGRCDFPAGSAETLYDSVHRKLYALPDETRVYTGHDYQPGGRPLMYESTIGAEKAGNIHLAQAATQEGFVTFRKGRDATLSAPRLLLPSIQVNIVAGHLPPRQSNGRRYLMLPLKE